MTVFASALFVAQSRSFADNFNVEDAVKAEWYVDVRSAIPVRGDEGEKSREVAAYSPDGRRAVFLTRQGNLEAGTTDFTLHLATLSGGKMMRKDLIRLSSDSNRPAIYAVRWISDERVGFIGERAGGTPQVMSVNVKGELTEHTKSDGEKLGFDIGANGTVVFGISVLPDAPADSADDSGYLVGDKSLADILGIKSIGWRRPTEYYVTRQGETRRLDGLSNGTSSFPPFISISPSGRYAVMATGPSNVPKEWANFPFSVKAAAGTPVHSSISMLSLINLTTRKLSQLSGAPMAWPRNKVQVVWDESNDRLFLIDQFVSAEQAAFLDGFADKLLPATFEFSLHTMRPERLIGISPAPERYVEGITAESARFDVASGKLEIVREGRLISYKETPDGWQREDGPKDARPAPERPFTLRVHQSVAEPAQMYADFADQKKRIPVGRINAPLKHKFNPARPYRWSDEVGRDWQAGLILPKDTREGEPLPLIIQSHTFSPHEFIITGDRGSSAGFSGQALASAGFVVLTMGFQNRELIGTKQEFETQSDGYRSAINALAADGIIDPAQVGIIAWSRSGFWLQHALAFKIDLFAAAIVCDASSFGQFYYLYFHNWPEAYRADYIAQSGTRPFGKELDKWQDLDPVTHVNSFTLPLLIESYGVDVPGWWQPYVAMKESNKPVEYFILPDAGHDPIQPQHRLVAQTMTVDWFRFWILHEVDPNPEKAMQFARWRKMRDEHCSRLKGNDDVPFYCRH